jgi:hypothetical protein
MDYKGKNSQRVGKYGLTILHASWHYSMSRIILVSSPHLRQVFVTEQVALGLPIFFYSHTRYKSELFFTCGHN